MKTLPYLLLAWFCVSTPFIMAMARLSSEQEIALSHQDIEIRKILEEKAVNLWEILKFFNLREPVKLQYMSNPVASITTNPMVYGDVKILSIPEAMSKSLDQETDEIKQFLAQKGIDVDQILTKMGSESKTIHFRFNVPGEDEFMSDILKQIIIVDKSMLNENSAEELIYLIGHELSHIKYRHSDDNKTLKSHPHTSYNSVIIAPFILWAGWLAFSLYKWPSFISLHVSELIIALAALFIATGCKGFYTIRGKAHQEEYFADREAVLCLNCANGAIALFEKLLEKNKQTLTANPTLKHRIYPDGNEWDIFHPKITDRIAAIKALQQQTQKLCA